MNPTSRKILYPLVVKKRYLYSNLMLKEIEYEEYVSEWH